MREISSKLRFRARWSITRTAGRALLIISCSYSCRIPKCRCISIGQLEFDCCIERMVTVVSRLETQNCSLSELFFLLLCIQVFMHCSIRNVNKWFFRTWENEKNEKKQKVRQAILPNPVTISMNIEHHTA